MRRKSQAFAALALLAIASGQAGAGEPELELDRVVAVVNNDVILSSELDRRMVLATVTKDATDPKKAMLWTMIDELLRVQLAVANGVTASDAEVDRALAEIRGQNQISEAQLLEELAKQGYSLTDYRRLVRHQIMAMRVLNVMLRADITVTDAEVKALFDARVKAAGGKPPPKFDDVKQELRNELFAKKMDVSTDQMTVKLRAQAFIDVRLQPPAKGPR